MRAYPALPPLLAQIVSKENGDRVRGLIEQNERQRIQLEDKQARSSMLEEQLKSALAACSYLFCAI